MKRLQEEEVKGPPELISSNPKEIGSSDDSDQVIDNTILIFLLPLLILIVLCLGRRRWK